ncbi:MAG: hypothetical protein GY714_18320 [Desulfobacterales bacterium]|nr:hypothetical protein [Desulfobacterales bacterium]
MSEEQAKYNKTITFTDLGKYVFGFCMQKIIRDSHKPDPLTLDIDYLKERCDQERNERLKAYRIWERNKTDRNAKAFIDEIADEIDFLIFQAGKVAGYTSMERK